MILGLRSTDGFKPKVGEVYRNQTVYFKNSFHKTNLMVLREATYEEYVEDCESNGVVPGSHFRKSNSTFWKVSVD